MSTPSSLPLPAQPKRVNYYTGMLLDSSDFQDEQTYHRGQLARALQRLHGFGTVAGLKVEWFAAGTVRAEDGQTRTDDELYVRSGIAADRLGRIIEVSPDERLRLSKWFEFQTTNRASLIGPLATGGTRELVADIFLGAIETADGLRPAFPQPVLDATDAVVSARTTERFRLILEPRRCDPANTQPPVPSRTTPAKPATRDDLLNSVYGSYVAPDAVGYPQNLGGVPATQTEVFLARVRIRLTDTPDTALTRHASQSVVIDDSARPLVPSGDALLALLS